MNPMVFAQAMPDANIILMVISSLATFGSCLAMIGMWFQNRKQQSRFIENNPLSIQLVEQFATKTEVRAELDKIKQSVDDLAREQGRKAESMHKKMNGISRNVYLIAGKLGIRTQPSSDEDDV